MAGIGILELVIIAGIGVVALVGTAILGCVIYTVVRSRNRDFTKAK